MAFDQFISYITNEKRYSPHTVISCKTDLSQFNDFALREFEISDLALIKNIHIRSWIASLSENGISNRSIQRKISSVRGYFKYLVKHQIIDNSPAEQLITPKANQDLPRYVEEKNLLKLIFDPTLFPQGLKGKRDLLILKLLYYTGMRLSELINLKESDVDFHQKTFKVLGKRSKERLIPVSNFLLVEIESYIEEKSHEHNGNSGKFLLLTDKGNKMYPKFVYRKVNHYLSQVTTLSKKSPHILRHSFATHMLNRGADLNAIKEILGHADLTATQVYTHNSITKLKNVHKQSHPKG